MISPHIPTTCQPALLAEVMGASAPCLSIWKQQTAHGVCDAIVVLSGDLRLYVIYGPSYPPMIVISFPSFSQMSR